MTQQGMDMFEQIATIRETYKQKAAALPEYGAGDDWEALRRTRDSQCQNLVDAAMRQDKTVPGGTEPTIVAWALHYAYQLGEDEFKGIATAALEARDDRVYFSTQDRQQLLQAVEHVAQLLRKGAQE